MFTEQFIQLGRDLCKGTLIVFLVIGIGLFLVEYGEDMVDACLEALGEEIRQTKQKKKRRHWRKRLKWKLRVLANNRLRVRYELADMDRKARKKAINSVANTLATHEELLEEIWADKEAIFREREAADLEWESDDDDGSKR